MVSVDRLDYKADTCDITIKDYHNFLTDAGVVVHNSEDLRFARTVERIQRILTSELYKIAIVHLYAQGYENEDLLDFKLELTSPSVVYEEEKIALWDAKTALAANIRDINLLAAD